MGTQLQREREKDSSMPALLHIYHHLHCSPLNPLSRPPHVNLKLKCHEICEGNKKEERPHLLCCASFSDHVHLLHVHHRKQRQRDRINGILVHLQHHYGSLTKFCGQPKSAR